MAVAIKAPAPTVTLSNNVCVANFSSPHPFTFEDGSVLPACDEARSRALSMVRKDQESPWPGLENVLAIKPVFVLTEEVLEELADVCQYWDVDVVLVPFPLLQALRDAGLEDRFAKAATVIMADRITKKAAIDKFGR